MADSAATQRLPVLAARLSGAASLPCGGALHAGVPPGPANIVLAVVDEKGNPVGGASSLRHFIDVFRQHTGTRVIPAIPSLLVTPPVVAMHRRRGGER
ncbi:TPA: hypothetical protein ACPYU1_002307 [Raoultella planticola]